MSLHRLVTLATLTLTLGLGAACGTGEDISDDDLQTECDSTHARVGKSAEFTGHFHSVAGTAVAQDDCTIRVDNFTYDGTGLDVRVYASATGDFATDGFAISNDLRRSGGYDNEELTISLPNGVTMDDFEHISIWCVSVSENFGDATF